MKLILISSSEKLNLGSDFIDKVSKDRFRDEANIVSQMFENGLQTFHLRKPRFSSKEMSNYLEKIPVKFHNRIVLHSHHFLAIKYGTKGINLSSNDKKGGFKKWLKLKWIQLQNPKLIITTSFSRTSSLFEEKYKYDYVFLSPIFDSLTGNFASGKQHSSIKSVLDRIHLKIIARGGVNAEKVGLVKELGFDGMAIHSAIWKKEDPVAEFLLFKNAFKELDIPIE